MTENASTNISPLLLNEVSELTILNDILKKLEDDESIKLSILHSELYFDNLLILKEKIDIQALTPILNKFIIHCNTETLLGDVISNVSFLKLLNLFLSVSSWKQHITVIGLILKDFLNNPNKYVNQIIIFFEHTLKNNYIPPNMIKFLQDTISFEDQTIIIALHYVNLILKTHLLLTVSHQKLMGTLIPILLSKINNENLSKVFIFLVLRSKSFDIRNIILNEITSSMLQLYEFLKAESLQNYPLLREKLENSIRNFFPIYNILNNNDFSLFAISYGSLNQLLAVDLLAFLNSPQTSFRELLYDYLIFYNGNKFPLFNILSKISENVHEFCYKNKNELKGLLYPSLFIFQKNCIIYELLVFQLQLWMSFANSNITNSDLQSLIDLIPVALKLIFKEVSSIKLDQSYETHFSALRMIIKSLSYEKLRSWQIEALKGRFDTKWSIQFKSFDKILKLQVYDFIKKQRLSKLQRGTWVSVQNPLDLALKPLSVYFIILSYNQNTLLAREFSEKTTKIPEVFDNKIIANDISGTNFPTISISLRSIGIYECEEFNTKTKSIRDHTYLINRIDNQYLCEISLLTKRRKVLLNFFIENKEDKFIWFDGLQLLSPFLLKENLSEETKEQINTLTKIIKQLQLMNLYYGDTPSGTEQNFISYNDKVTKILGNNNDYNNSDNDIDEDADENDIYNLETLKEISQSSFYD